MPKQSQMAESSLRDLYQRLLEIDRETFAGEEYDIAYHALVAALHCGQTLKDIEYLVEVEQLAKKHLDWIDAHHPEYDHSSQSASKRNHASVYETLAQQARARVAIIQNAAKTFPHVHNRRDPASSGK